MYLLGYLVIFFSGLFVGSFLNLISDRLDTEESIFIGRSKCSFCGKNLTPKELVPVFSFLYQRGKCLNCKKTLSKLYPLSELLTGAMFVLAAYSANIFTDSSLLVFFYFLFVFSAYVILFLTDIKFRLLPNKVIFPTIAIVLLYTIGIKTYDLATSYIYLKNDEFGKYLLDVGLWNDRLYLTLQQLGFQFLSALGIFAFFWLLIVLTKGRGMGGGDLKLSLLIGLFNVFPINILSIFLGFLTGAVFSVFLILVRVKTIKDTIPFGPFLILGSLLGNFFGNYLIYWYFGLFNS
ncbi:MAG: prepilin peptidase [Patescibacteria group bacterium]